MKNDQGAAQSTPELLPIVQADREAAADLHKAQGYTPVWVQEIRDGKHDYMHLVKAFARHRIEHTTPDRNAVLESLPDDEATANRIIDAAWREAGLSSRPFFGEAYEPGVVIRSIVQQVAALTTALPRDERLDYERRILAAECSAQRVLNELRDKLRKRITAIKGHNEDAANALRDVVLDIEEIDVCAPEPTDPAGVSEMAERVAREVMADMLGLSPAEVDAESRGAQLIREGIRRYVTLRPDPVLAAAKEALGPFAAYEHYYMADPGVEDEYLPDHSPHCLGDYRRARAALKAIGAGQ